MSVFVIHFDLHIILAISPYTDLGIFIILTNLLFANGNHEVPNGSQ
jgi:hypothetical protein